MPHNGRTILTAGRIPDGSTTGRGRHRQAAMTTLMMCRTKVMPQNDAAAMAESVIAAAIGASNDKAVTGTKYTERNLLTGRPRRCHCERSEAIQSLRQDGR